MESYLKKQKEYNTPEDNPIEKPEKLYGSLPANPGTTDSLINKENEAMFMPQPQFRPPSYGYLSPPKYERLSPNSDYRTDVEGEILRTIKNPSPSPVIVNEPVVQRGDRMAAIREARLKRQQDEEADIQNAIAQLDAALVTSSSLKRRKKTI